MEYYARHILLPNVGLEGQKRIRKTRVFVVGAGGLGAGVIPNLAGLGFGFIRILDGDTIELGNLHRQTLFNVNSIGSSKAEVAANIARGINPHICVEEVHAWLSVDNIMKYVSDIDIIFDCTDSLPIRRLISDASEILKITVISGSALMCHGQILLYGPGRGSYRKLLGSQLDLQKPDSKSSLSPQEQLALHLENELTPKSQGCTIAGVLGPVPSLIGNLMSQEGVCHVLKIHRKYNFIVYDMADTTNQFRYIMLKERSCEPSVSSFIPEQYVSQCAVSKYDREFTDVSWAEVIPNISTIVSQGIILDVRTANVSNVDSLKGALKIPYENLCFLIYEDLVSHTSKLWFETFKGRTEIYVYCRLGNSSRSTIDVLERYREVLLDKFENDNASANLVTHLHSVKLYNISEGFNKIHGFIDREVLAL